MIRIQSGTARGRKLISLPKGYEVRPILARIRKSLFDILRPRIKDVLFLDLFAGVGTVGLEALSNGAARAIFVDRDKTSIKRVEKNINHLGFQDRARVHQGDATESLQWLSGEKCGIIFMGPPYKDENKLALHLTVPTLDRLAEAGLLAPEGLVVGQHHEKENLSGLSKSWTITRQNEYGDSVLSFFEATNEK